MKEFSDEESEKLTLLWVKLVRRALRVRFLQRIWHELGEYLKCFGSHTRLQLRRTWLPLSGKKPKK